MSSPVEITQAQPTVAETTQVPFTVDETTHAPGTVAETTQAPKTDALNESTAALNTQATITASKTI